MSHFLLIHGSWHGAWCWRHLIPELRARSHTASAIDLPAHGGDTTPYREVTFQNYVDAVFRALDEMEAEGAPILVGHSMAGMVIAAVAAHSPDRVRAIVPLSALQVPAGLSMLDAVGSGADPEYLREIEWAADGLTASITSRGARTCLYPLCPPEIASFAVPLLTPEPIGPMTTRMQVTAEGFRKVPRYCILCSEDRALPPAVQYRMARDLPPDELFTIKADHSPFFSAPSCLADILHQVAAINI